jgi:hypothetical protein
MNTIKRISHLEIDFKKWDATILSSQLSLVFAQSFYLNATCPNWDALIIGDYESVFPLTYKIKYGITYLHQPSFTPQLGVYGKVNDEVEKLFFEYITANFKLIEIEVNATNLVQSKYHTPKNTYMIDYAKGYKFNQNTKRNCNKALENKLVFVHVNLAEVIALSAKHLNPFLTKQLHLSTATIKLFEALLQSAINNNALHTFKVIDKENNLQAIAHFISNGKHTVYLKGINFDKEVSLGSMHLLNSSAIQFFENKSQLFDFGGGTKESLANFYQGFGAIASTYHAIKVNHLPWLIKLLKKIS